MEQCRELRGIIDEMFSVHKDHPMLMGVDVMMNDELYQILLGLTDVEERGILARKEHVDDVRPQLAKMTRMLRTAGVRTEEGNMLYNSAKRNRAVKKKRVYVLRNSAKYDNKNADELVLIAKEQAFESKLRHDLVMMLHGVDPLDDGVDAEKIVNAYIERDNRFSIQEMHEFIQEAENHGDSIKSQYNRLRDKWVKYHADETDKPAPLTKHNMNSFRAVPAAMDKLPSFF